MFSDDDLIPLSALADICFCERRAALHFIEMQWQDSSATLEGTHLHQQVDLPGVESRGDLRIARGLLVKSLRLGLSGKLDVVEFHKQQGVGEESGGRMGATGGGQDGRGPWSAGILPALAISLPGISGFWAPFPVEYKKGRLRKEEGYEVQLCAQALCLEEMLSVHIPAGAIYYGANRRRLEISFTDELRAQTESAAARLHELVCAGVTPKAFHEPKCERCSLLDRCRPEALAPGKSATRYLTDATEGGLRK